MFAALDNREAVQWSMEDEGSLIPVEKKNKNQSFCTTIESTSSEKSLVHSHHLHAEFYPLPVMWGCLFQSR